MTKSKPFAVIIFPPLRFRRRLAWGIYLLTSMISGWIFAADSGEMNELIPEHSGKVLEAFPPPSANEKRWVVTLPRKTNEDEWQIEVLSGQNLKVDCNQHLLSGKIETLNIEGWGYEALRVSTATPASKGMISTKMACPHPGAKITWVSGPSQLLRYNSALPVVVYTPKDIEVKYRLWQANQIVHAQEK